MNLFYTKFPEIKNQTENMTKEEANELTEEVTSFLQEYSDEMTAYSVEGKNSSSENLSSSGGRRVETRLTRSSSFDMSHNKSEVLIFYRLNSFSRMISFAVVVVCCCCCCC